MNIAFHSNLTLMGLLLALCANAQNKFVNKADGQPMYATRYAEVEGTPYWDDNFVKSEAKSIQNGKWYSYEKARFDCYKNELEYEQSANRFMYLGHEQISEFRLNGVVFRCGFPAINEWSNRHFYQVLYDGEVKLLKHIHNRVVTEAIFGNVTKLSKFEREEQYYVFKQGEMKRLKRKKGSVLEALAEKQDALLQYAKSNNLDFSSEEDLKKIVGFYDGR